MTLFNPSQWLCNKQKISNFQFSLRFFNSSSIKCKDFPIIDSEQTMELKKNNFLWQEFDWWMKVMSIHDIIQSGTIKYGGGNILRKWQHQKFLDLLDWIFITIQITIVVAMFVVRTFEMKIENIRRESSCKISRIIYY